MPRVLQIQSHHDLGHHNPPESFDPRLQFSARQICHAPYVLPVYRAIAARFRCELSSAYQPIDILSIANCRKLMETLRKPAVATPRLKDEGILLQRIAACLKTRFGPNESPINPDFSRDSQYRRAYSNVNAIRRTKHCVSI